MPTVSVIIPCYNQGQYLAESIGSVLSSDYQKLEIIVVDDGSTETATQKILAELDFPHTRLIHRNNGGLAAARNSGIAAAQGRYILPLDADDRIGPRYISQAVAALGADQNVGIVYCQAEKFGAETGPWRLAPFSHWRMALGNVIFCSAIYRRDDWSSLGGYDETLRQGWEDWDFWLGLLEHGRTVHCLPETGFYYRKHARSMAAGMKAEIKIDLHQRMMIKHSRFFSGWSVLLAPLLPLYYRLADIPGYRAVKKGVGR